MRLWPSLPVLGNLSMIAGLGGEEEEIEALPGGLLAVRVPPGGLLVGLSMTKGPPSGLGGGLEVQK